MKTYAILLILILSGVSAIAQSEPPKQFMFESKFKDLYLRLDEDKKTVEASANDYGTPCFIRMGEIRRAHEPKGFIYFIQIKNDEVIFDTYERPEMTDEEARAQFIDQKVDPESADIEVIDHKSVWYFEPSGDEGYFYIVTPYDPYPGHCLTINNEIGDGEYEVVLAPKKNSLDDDQKWRLILLPHDDGEYPPR